MDYVFLVISGVVMGLIAAVPVGPVNLICIRRTFAYGPVNGFMSGLGAALGDGIFAMITGFGLTWLAQLIKGYAPIIELVGGAMLIYFGVHAFITPLRARIDDSCKDKGASTLARAMASTFALTVTNPATLLAFTGMFAALSGLVGGRPSFLAAGFVVAGVVGGSAAWWLALTSVIGIFHARIDERIVRIINRCFGAIVALCGIGFLTHAMMMLKVL